MAKNYKLATKRIGQSIISLEKRKMANDYKTFEKLAKNTNLIKKGKILQKEVQKVQFFLPPINSTKKYIIILFPNLMNDKWSSECLKSSDCFCGSSSTTGSHLSTVILTLRKVLPFLTAMSKVPGGTIL